MISSPYLNFYSRTNPLKTFAGHLCALIFTWIAADLTLHVRSLQGTPVALNFAVVVAVTMIFGIGPGIASVLSTAAIFYWRFLLPGSASPYATASIVRVVLILGIGFLLAFLSQRQRTTGLRLRSALASLREHADTLAHAQQGSRSAAWVFHARDGRLHWAQGGAELLGRPFEGIDRLDALCELAYADDRSAIEQVVEQTRRDGTLFHAEFRAVLPNGDTRWLEMRGAPSPDRELWRGVVLDVTDRKNAEIALVRSEKLAAIGRLSATVAHEINNPLEAVTNLLYLASSDPALPAEAKAYLQSADHELQRLASIARHTLTYARTNPDTTPTDIAPVVENVVAMFRTRCNSRGGMVHMIATDDLRVAVPRDDLRQILTNLVSNSCDALAKTDGLVEVEIFRERESAVIHVRDNGSGISQVDLEKIFDAFFTTKDDVGTGIGLWVTKELVEKSGGRITVDSGPQLAPFSTSFRVELPLSRQTV